VSGVIIEGLTLTGAGAASHDAAGIYLRKADLSYIGPDYIFRDINISGFRKGTSIANVTTLRMDCVSVRDCRIGHDWYLVQTGLMTQLRVVAGDGSVDGACFELSGGPSYGLSVIGGEYGGYYHFLKTTGTVKIAFDSVNIEGITSGIICNFGSNGWLSFQNSKIQQTISATGSIISYPNSGASNIYIDWANNETSLATPGGVIVECVGPDAYRGPRVSGETVSVAYSSAQGDARAAGSIRLTPPNCRRSFTAALLPSDASTGIGDLHVIGAATAKTTDEWADNLILRQRDNNTGNRRWSSLVNDMLFRVLGVSARTASGNNVETDIQNVTLPIGALRNNGESVDIELFGTTANNTNNKHFRFYFGGSLYLDFGALPIENQAWTIKVRIQRGGFGGGTGYMKMIGTLDYGAGRVIKAAETPSAAIDSNATIATRTTVLTPTAASDAVSLAAKTTWLRAPTTLTESA
jgi:hypothetical protein